MTKKPHSSCSKCGNVYRWLSYQRICMDCDQSAWHNLLDQAMGGSRFMEVNLIIDVNSNANGDVNSDANGNGNVNSNANGNVNSDANGNA